MILKGDVVSAMKVIDVPTAIKRLQEDAVLIDVLPEEEYQHRHIPGAINIPVGREDFETRVAKAVPDKSRPVIVYSTDKQSEAGPTAARRLDQMGYERVFDLQAGIEGWRKEGHSVDQGAPQVQARI